MDAILVSICIHLAFVIITLFSDELGLTRQPPIKPRIHAVWIDLPKGHSDIPDTHIKKSKTLPKSTIQDQKNFTPEKKPSQKALAPKIVKTKPISSMTIAKKPKKIKQPSKKITKKIIKKTQPKVKKINKTDKDIASALAKIDTQLKQRNIQPQAAQVKKDGNGFKYGTANQAIRVPRTDPDYLRYQAMIRSKIIRSWIPPIKYLEGDYNIRAELVLMINEHGDVTDIKWSSTSNSQSFDQSALRAIRNASPLPTPPEKLEWEAYNEGFLVVFHPQSKR